MGLVRDSMLHLIERERDLINDPAGTVFRDDQIQDALDQYRREVRYAALRPQPTYGPGAAGVSYLDYYSDLQNWEDDAQLQDLSYLDITSQVTLAEPLSGHWAFALQPTNGPGVRITGKVYDVYASAALLLEQRATKVMMNYTFSADNERFALSEQVTNILAVARQYRLQAQPRMLRITQSDAEPDVEGTGIVYPADPGGWY